MPDTKRLDIQFGSFACSVQGFDDPVQPVQQVLQALQSLLEETPDLADAEISFDAESIERLIGEVARRADIAEENVEIVPGLVIVHRSAEQAALQASRSADEDKNRSSSPPLVAGKEAGGIADENGQPTAADGGEPRAEPAYVNIFSPGASAAVEDAVDTDPQAVSSGAGDDIESDPLAAFATDDAEQADDGNAFSTGSFTDRLARASAAVVNPADAIAAADSAPVRNVFADRMDGDSAGENTANVFSTIDDASENTSDQPTSAGNMFASNELELTEPVTELKISDKVDQSSISAETGNGKDDTSDEVNSERVSALFGASDDQPEVEEVDEGYTAAGLAKTAEAETVAELMVCAAAWMVLIQGQTTFKRKEVVEVFATIPGDHSKSLEAKIKGFGKAVRNSQLVMIEDGVFGISRVELERFQMLL